MKGFLQVLLWDILKPLSKTKAVTPCTQLTEDWVYPCARESPGTLHPLLRLTAGGLSSDRPQAGA